MVLAGAEAGSQEGGMPRMTAAAVPVNPSRLATKAQAPAPSSPSTPHFKPANSCYALCPLACCGGGAICCPPLTGVPTGGGGGA